MIVVSFISIIGSNVLNIFRVVDGNFFFGIGVVVVKVFSGFDLIFEIKGESFRFVINMVGIFIINLYNMVKFRFVLNIFVMVVGVGWGGRNLCVMDREVNIGILIYSKGSCKVVVIVKISGINIIKFIE